MKEYDIPKWVRNIYADTDEIRSTYTVLDEIDYEEDSNIISQLVAEFMGWV